MVYVLLFFSPQLFFSTFIFSLFLFFLCVFTNLEVFIFSSLSPNYKDNCVILYCQSNPISHRRRMKREAKAKVSVWGGKICSLSCRANYFASLSIWKNSMNSTVSSKSTAAKQLARQEIEQVLPP